MDILKQVSELKEFLGTVYCFLEDNEDKLEGVDEFEEIKKKTWDWQQELAKFLPDMNQLLARLRLQYLGKKVLNSFGK